jgi:hypothetical protein
MHIPLDIVKEYYAATEGTGSCAVIAVAQVRQFALSRDEAVATDMTSASALAWERKMLKPLNDWCVLLKKNKEKMPNWRVDADPIWKKHGLDGKKPKPETKTDNYVNTDSFIEMVQFLNLKVNWWLGCVKEGTGEDANKDVTTTTYLLSSIIRDKQTIEFFDGIKLTDVLLIADDNAVNVLQTGLHFFVCPDISVNEALNATAHNLFRRWSNKKWKKVIKEESLTSEQLSRGLDVDTVLWDKRTFRADALMVRRRHISDADEIIVEHAFMRQDTNVLISRWNIPITNRIIKCLLPDQMLNDEVINYYMHMLQEHDDKNKDRVGSHYFSSFFMNKLMDCDKNGYSFDQVQR